MAAILLVAFAALVLWLRYDALPNADRYRDRIAASIGRASGMVVKARAIRGGWEGLRPRLELDGLEIVDRAGHPAVVLERAEATLQWWALFAGRVRFHDVDFYRPTLVLRRGADGVVYLGDQPLRPTGGEDGSFGPWLLAQPRLGVHDATLVWRDELAGVPEVRLTEVQLAVRRHLGRHLAALTAVPPPELSGRIDVRTDLAIRRTGMRWSVDGVVFFEGLHTDLAGLRAHLPVPDSLKSAVGSLRVWATLADGNVREAVADVNLRDARAQLASDSLPLSLASISGRASYSARADGFSFTTQDLRFRLASGEEVVPGRFSLQQTLSAHAAPRVEVTADGIDLKIAAILIDYFPVPRDIRNGVRRFAPRGRLIDTALSWSGEDTAHARSYAVKGRFEDLGVNAVDAMPGITGLSGSLEGTEAGGTLRLESRGGELAMPRVFRADVPIARLEADVAWRRLGNVLEVELKHAAFENVDTAGSVAGTWRSQPEATGPAPGFVDFKGRLTRASAVSVPSYVPNGLAITRDWVERSLRDGRSDRVDFQLRGDLRRFPFASLSDGVLRVEGDLHGARLKYNPDWPSVDAIEGTFLFENRRMEIHAASARIFASPATGVSATIQELGAHPALLVVDGDVDTTGSDATRFLRESPLVNGPGSFTRAIAVEGPGHLKLHLVVPIGGAGPPVHVEGDYRFAGATATVSRTLALRDLQGDLAFSERGVSAPAITATLRGSPARLTMSSQPDGAVLSTLESRIDAAAFADFLPAAIARRLSGEAAWKARIVSAREATSLTLVSDLVGVAVTLPAPFAKDATQSRSIAIAIEHLARPEERTDLDLAGGIQGRFSRSGPEGAQRWNAILAFDAPIAEQPSRPGVRLYGRLEDVDVDAWRTVFAPVAAVEPAATVAPDPAVPAISPLAAAFAAPAAGSPTAATSAVPAAGSPTAATSAVPTAAPPAAPELALDGFDLTVHRLHYLEHDFSSLHAVLERSDDVWSGHLEGDQLAGDVRWDGAGHGKLTTRLTRLTLAPGWHAVTAAAGTRRDADLPTLDVGAKRFEFGGHWLGELTLEAQPAGEEWRIERLDIANDHAHFSSSGRWRRTDAGSTTTLTLKLDSSNLNKLLGQFGYGDYLKRGTGELQGTLAWPGYPSDFALASLAGDFKVEGKSGQFAKIEPGAGKLLGLLSLQSLPRRALLDFRDVFSDGFAFERIHGDVRIAHGVLHTDDFEITGPSAFVAIAGEASMPDETQRLTLRVVPEVSEGVALAATILGTPVLGLSTLLVSKILSNPLGKAVAYEYQVTGSWDNPQVTRLAPSPPKSAAAQP